MIKKMILKIRESIWLLPGIYSLFSFLLALVVIYIDHQDLVEDVLPSFLMTNIELAQTILGAISASLLTMTSITFSTIMVVLTTYSTQFSPRTLNNFVEDPLTMRVLGIFMGGFVYSILALLFMNKNWYEHEVIAATVGVGIAFVCLAFFAYFIHNVATSIQVSTLIKDLTDGTLNAITRQKEEQESEYTSIVDSRDSMLFSFKSIKDIQSKEYGYVQLIDYEKLKNYAIEHNVGIELTVMVGDFLTADSLPIRVYHNQDELDFDSRHFLKLGKDRSTLQDPEFGIQKLVEVALRSISPAINDPNTARNCILHMGLALSELCTIRKKGRYIIYQDREQNPKVIARQKNSHDILYFSFYQIVHYGQHDLSILLAVIDAFLLIGKKADDSTKKVIWQLYSYSMEKFKMEELKELDKIILADKNGELATLLGKSL